MTVVRRTPRLLLMSASLAPRHLPLEAVSGIGKQSLHGSLGVVRLPFNNGSGDRLMKGK